MHNEDAIKLEYLLLYVNNVYGKIDDIHVSKPSNDTGTPVFLEEDIKHQRFLSVQVKIDYTVDWFRNDSHNKLFYAKAILLCYTKLDMFL